MKSPNDVASGSSSPTKPQTTFSLLVDKSKSGEKVLEMKCAELKEMAEKIHKANELKSRENRIKDSEIDTLNDEIEKVMLNNYDLEMAISKELELRNKYESEQRRIANYCNDLKSKFNNMQKTIKDYEDSIAAMKEENQKLSDEYERKIAEIEAENQKIVKKIDDRIELFNHQKRIIIENESKVDNLIKEIETQKNVFEERAMLNKIKFTELEKQYSALQKKVYEMQMNCEIKKVEGGSKRNKNVFSQVDIEKQIQEYEISNEKLVMQIKDLTKTWKEMSMGSASTMDAMSNVGTKGKRTNRMNSPGSNGGRTERTNMRTRSAK